MSEKQQTKNRKQQQHRNELRFKLAILDEIETLKAKIRTAYALDIRQKDGETLSEEELQLLEEQSLNSRVLERLQAVRDTAQNRNTEKRIADDYTQVIFKFFYLVRLAQQGFFYLVSSIYPSIEYPAVAYLADKLIGTSLHYANSVNPKTRRNYKSAMYDIVDNLRTELDEPVAEGFRTTYKQIMNAIHHLSYQGIHQPHQANENDQGEPSKSAPQAMPPIWVVMPYTSMMDNASFALPGTQPTLPFPTNMVPPGLTHPFAQHQQPKKHKGRKSNRKTDDEASVKQEEDEQPKEQVNTKEQKIEEEKIEEDKVKENGDDRFEDDFEDDDDDRFADPESDYEDEEDEEDKVEEPEKQEVEVTIEVKSQVVEEPETPAESVSEEHTTTGSESVEKEHTTTGSDATNDKEKEQDASSSWKTFAASSQGDDDLSSRLVESRTSPKIIDSRGIHNTYPGSYVKKRNH